MSNSQLQTRPATENPFAEDPVRRYDYAWKQLAGRSGRHLDVGCGRGDFLAVLAGSSRLDCYGVDAHAGYLEDLHARHPHLQAVQVPNKGAWSFPDRFFDSVSMLDVLEHVADEDFTLAEVHRVLAPGGVLVLTVPAQHIFSFLDPDNAKLQFPRIHRAVYTARFGATVYRERFVDLSNGMRGDMSVERSEHTNYHPEALLDRLSAMGFRCIDRAGANLFWRWLDTPAMLAGRRLKRILDRAILWDGKRFTAANLFLTFERLRS